MALKTFTKDVDLGGTGYSSARGTLRLTVNENSTSVSANKSYCDYTLQLIISAGSWRAGSGSWSISGNTSNSGSIASMTYYSGTTTLATGSFEVGHSSNGSGSFSLNMSFSSSYNLNGSGTLSGTLTNIPRQANLTGAPDFNDEDNPTINYSNPAGNSVNSLQARIEDTTGSTAFAAYRDIGKTNSSYTFELTSAERTSLRQAAVTNELDVRFVVKTVISNNTYYSRLTKKMTIINGEPTFENFTFEDVNETTTTLTGNNQYNVNGYSNIKAIISTANKATANKEATMSKYRFIIGDKSVDINYSSSETVEGTIEKSQNGIYDVYAIDSRNNSKLVTKLAATVIPYEKVYIDKTATNVTRDNNQIGENVTLTLNGTFWNDTFGAVTNTIKSITYKFKKTTSDTWIDGTTSITPTIADNQFSFTGLIASDNQDTTWDVEDSYNIQIIVEDELSTANISLLLNSGIPTLSMDKKGVGIMCSYDDAQGEGLQVKGVPVSPINNSSIRIGKKSLSNNTTGDDNVSMGSNTLYSNTTGKGNTAIGHGALYGSTTGNYNTAVGIDCLNDKNTGNNNTGVGRWALSDNTSGYQNTAVGLSALGSNKTGNNNSALGMNANAFSTEYSNTTSLGYNSAVTGSNQVQLGNSSTSVYAYSNINLRSDKRDKKDIKKTDLGLEFIKKLKPVKYKWKFRDKSYEGNRYHEGLIAQDVKKVMDELDVEFGGYQDHKINGGEDVLTLGYGEFIAPLIKAIQEQQEMIEKLEKKIEKLSVKND